MEKSNRLTAIFILILLTGWLYYESLPSFHVYRSFVKISDSGVETTLEVITYKMFNSAELYKQIADEYNRINGVPNRLEINLYALGHHYQTVIFDYESHFGF